MSVLVPRTQIEQTILVIRGHRVMLESDLAELYGVTAGRLNEAVKRNEDRFPSDFMFQLTKPEFEHLKSQIAISSSRWGGRRHAPYAITEQGTTMLSSVFRNERARAPIGHGTMPHWYRSTRTDIHCSERLAYGG
jgi:hypothetical protein